MRRLEEEKLLRRKQDLKNQRKSLLEDVAAKATAVVPEASLQDDSVNDTDLDRAVSEGVAQTQDLLKTTDKPLDDFDEGSDNLLVEAASKTIVEEIVSAAFDNESDELLLDAVRVSEVERTNLGHGTFRQVPDPPDQLVIEADIRSRRVVQDFLAWRGSRGQGPGCPALSLGSERIMKLTLPVHSFFLIKPYQAQTPVINGH